MSFLYKPFAFFLLHVSLFATLQLLSWIEATNRNRGTTIDLIHRDSPLSPSYNPSKSHFERLQSSFQRSISRKSSIHRLSTLGRTSTPQQDIHAPLASNGFEYLMKIAIGTPPVEVLAIADTGSDLTWTQCKPCTRCYTQKLPLFDPKKSSTYTRVSCPSLTCDLANISPSDTSPSCDKSSKCAYRYSYGDNSYTVGDLSSETFTFGSGFSVPSVVFGCGHNNAGTFSASGSGLVGLGNGELSIVNQLAKSIGGKFSYCLTLIGSNATSKLNLGANSSVVGPNVVSTPLVKKDPDTFYYLTLEGVSVGENRLSCHESGEVEEGNIIIDSGTTLTFLPSDLYSDLESAFVDSVKGTRAPSSEGSTFRLCYEKSDYFSAPPLTVHFRGADFELARESLFLEVEQGVVCLTLVPSDGMTIFGNLHQMNVLIGYDVEGNKVNFMSTDCSKSG